MIEPDESSRARQPRRLGRLIPLRPDRYRRIGVDARALASYPNDEVDQISCPVTIPRNRRPLAAHDAAVALVRSVRRAQLHEIDDARHAVAVT